MLNFDYTRVQIGDKVRDSQTLESGTIVDVSAISQWAIVITVVLAISSMRKTYTLPSARPTSPNTTVGAGQQEVRGGELRKVGLKKIADAEVGMNATTTGLIAKRQSGRANPVTEAKTGPLDRLAKYIESSYQSGINDVKKDDVLALLSDIKKAGPEFSDTLSIPVESPSHINSADGMYLIDRNTEIKGNIHRALSKHGLSDKYDEKIIDNLILIVERHEGMTTARREGSAVVLALSEKPSYLGVPNSISRSDLLEATGKSTVSKKKLAKLGELSITGKGMPSSERAKTYTTINHVKKLLNSGTQPEYIVEYLENLSAAQMYEAKRLSGIQKEIYLASDVLERVGLQGTKLKGVITKDTRFAWAIDTAIKHGYLIEAQAIEGAARSGASKSVLRKMYGELGATMRSKEARHALTETGGARAIDAAWESRNVTDSVLREFKDLFPEYLQSDNPGDFTTAAADTAYELESRSSLTDVISAHYSERAERARLRAMNIAGTHPSPYHPTSQISVTEYDAQVKARMMQGTPLHVERDGLLYELTGTHLGTEGEDLGKTFFSSTVKRTISPSSLWIETNLSRQLAADGKNWSDVSIFDQLSSSIEASLSSVDHAWSSYVPVETNAQQWLGTYLSGAKPAQEGLHINDFLLAYYGGKGDPIKQFSYELQNALSAKHIDALGESGGGAFDIVADALTFYQRKATEEYASMSKSLGAAAEISMLDVIQSVFAKDPITKWSPMLAKHFIAKEDAVSMESLSVHFNDGETTLLQHVADPDDYSFFDIGSGDALDNYVFDPADPASITTKGVRSGRESERTLAKILKDLNLPDYKISDIDLHRGISHKRFAKSLSKGLVASLGEDSLAFVNGKLAIKPSAMNDVIGRLSEMDVIIGKELAKLFGLNYTVVDGKLQIDLHMTDRKTGAKYKSAGKLETGEAVVQDAYGKAKYVLTDEAINVDLPHDALLKGEYKSFDSAQTAIRDGAVVGEAIPLYRTPGGMVATARSPSEFANEVTRVKNIISGKQTTLIALDIESSMEAATYGHITEGGLHVYTREGTKASEGFKLKSGDVWSRMAGDIEAIEGVATTRVAKEATIINNVYKALTANPDAYLVLHNAPFDLPQLARRAEELGLPAAVSSYFRNQAARVVDTMRTTTQLYNPNMPGFGLQDIAKEMKLRGKNWIEEHRSSYDIQTMMDVLNEQLFGTGREQTVANIKGIDLSGQGAEQLSGKYFWNARDRKLYTVGIGEPGEKSYFARLAPLDPKAPKETGALAILLQEETLHTGVNKESAFVRQSWTMGREWNANFKEVTAAEGAELQNRAIEDLAFRRIRRMENSVSGTAMEQERIRLAEQFKLGGHSVLTPEILKSVEAEVEAKLSSGALNISDYLDAVHEALTARGEKASNVAEWAAEFMSNPRMLDQLDYVNKNYFESETFQQIINPVHKALADSGLPEIQQNSVLREFINQLSDLAPRPEITSQVDQYSRKISFLVDGLGKNPKSIRIGSMADMNSDILSIAQDYVKVAPAERLSSILQNQMSGSELSEFLISREMSTLKPNQAETVVRSLQNHEIFNSIKKHLTPFAKKIGGRKIHNATKKGVDETLEALLDLGKRKNITKAQAALMDEADFIDYGSDWLSGSEKLDQAKALSDDVVSTINSGDTAVQKSHPAFKQVYSGPAKDPKLPGIIPDDPSIPHLLRGRSITAALSAHTLKEIKGNRENPLQAVRKAKGDLLQAMHDTYYGDGWDLLDEGTKSHIEAQLEIKRLNSANTLEDIVDLHIPAGRNRGKTFGSLKSRTALNQLLVDDNLAEEFRNTVRGLFEKTTPEAMRGISAVDIATRHSKYGNVIGLLGEAGESMMHSAGRVFSGGEGRVAKVALIAAIAGTALFMSRKPNLKSDQETMSPQARYRREVSTSEKALNHRIAVQIAGDKGGVPGVTDADVVAAARSAVEKHLLGGVQAGNIGGSDNTTKQDKRQLDATAALLMTHRGRLL